MTYILIFMVLSLFFYTRFLKYHNILTCPRCDSNKIIKKDLTDHTLFTCQTCKFSYKDYYSFYFLTPIPEQYDIEFEEDEYDDDEYD